MPSLNDPVAFEFFGLSIRWYAIFILTGIFAALALSTWLARRRGLDPAFILDMAPVVILGGIIGARLTYVLVSWDRFRDDPLDAVNIRLGGLSIHGAVLFGTLIVWWYCRRHRQPFLAWGDLILAGVALGQAIGRWGNWANQEAFGTPTDLPWAIRIAPEHRPPEYADSATFHPTFLYESICNLANAIVLSWIIVKMPGSDRLRPGDAVWAYMVLYGCERLVIESIRTDSVYVGPLPGPTWASLALIAGGVVGFVVARRTRAPQVAEPSEPAVPEQA